MEELDDVRFLLCVPGVAVAAFAAETVPLLFRIRLFTAATPELELPLFLPEARPETRLETVGLVARGPGIIKDR